MNENENPTDGTVDEIEDVEAHGMREVVVGLSAAAVLTGGAAAVISAQGSGQGGSSTIHATDAIAAESLADDDVKIGALGSDVGGPASFRSAGASGGAVAQISASTDALQDAADSADDVASPNRGLVARTNDRVDSTVDRARELRDAALDTAGNTVAAARTTVKEEVRDAGTAVRTAPQTAGSAVDNLRTGTVTTPGVGQTVRSAGTTVRSAGTTVDSTITLVGDSVRSAVGGAQTTIARIQPGVGSGVNVKDASGWVSVTVGGEEIARAEVVDGQATVSWEAPSVNLPVTFHYSGSDLLSPATTTL
ncbi:MAG TPA: hypothetical protein VNA14_00970 [Mycobacteriales bacterium]|nr:hypothetical protein [Mycobacteriales bacterium]